MRQNRQPSPEVEGQVMVPVRNREREINAADVEHITALASGVAMMLVGFRAGGLKGALLKLGGLALLYRGQHGYRRLYEAVGVPLPQVPTGVGRKNVRVDATIDVRRPRNELYHIWRNLENLPVFMEHLKSVHEIDDKRSIWVAEAPAGMVVKWDAEIINEVPNELIAWQTLEGSGVDNAGSVRFEDAGDGVTRIRLILRYDPPGDLVGYWIARVFGSDPQKHIEEDLRRFKAIMEIGGQRAAAELAASEAEVDGTGA
jgi:uncharacterized membrane protein